MNDNQGPEDNVIDLMASACGGEALVIPSGLRDVVVLGFLPDGKLYFNSDSQSLAQISHALLLAGQRVARYHVDETDDE